LLSDLKFRAFITITVSFSDDFRYASDTSSAGPIISDSTSRENVTDGRGGETGSGGFSSTYQSGVGRAKLKYSGKDGMLVVKCFVTFTNNAI